MMEAVQPYIDSAISKTVNVPADCPYEAFRDLYLHAWRAGLEGADHLPAQRHRRRRAEHRCRTRRDGPGDHGDRPDARGDRERPRGALEAVAEKVE